jgi:hypothetical protein
MTALLIAMLVMVSPASQDTFALRCDLQAVYDEMTQVTLLSKSADDVDLFHAVFYAPDFVFIDAEGQPHGWAQLRGNAIQALRDPPVDQVRQTIRDVTPTSDGAIALTAFITVRTIVDHEGRYGQAGSPHSLAKVTTFRDTFVKSGTSWKLKAREQIGASKTLIDNLPPELDHPRYSS